MLTPKGEYASALQKGVKAQYAGSVQPVPAAAANLAAFRHVADHLSQLHAGLADSRHRQGCTLCLHMHDWLCGWSA